MLEFYDFVIYGIFSVYFAHQFFPSDQAIISVIESYVVFILGYIARPIGGMIFSHIGDEHGRKKVLVFTIILMGISSLGIGLLPTYNQIGVIAPILLLIFRLIQGLALGGELPSTFVYISESMHNKRGIGFGLTMSGVNSGLLLGMVINQLLNLFLTPTELNNYGWRLPFILGGVVCIVSYKIRESLHETELFKKIQHKSRFPLIDLFKNHLPQLIIGIAYTAILAGSVMVFIIFMPTYFHTILKIDNKSISYVLALGMLTNVIVIYVIGRFTDYIKPFIIIRNLLIISIVFIPFCYFLIHNHGWLMMVGVWGLCAIEGVAAMIVPLLVTCLFPTKIRLTGVAMSYNLGFSLFGGMAPIVISSLVKIGFGVFITPVCYLFVIIVVCGLGVAYARKYTFESIS